MDPEVARQVWRLVEPYHACVYFAPEARARYDGVGLRGGWMGYFASRAAPMGPVPAPVVVATFFGFHPDMVRRAIPDAWSFATPAAVTQARWAVADDALRRLLGPDVAGDDVVAAAELAALAAEAGDVVGRPLFAAHTTLEHPSDPHLALWRAVTLLREHRGDGHVAALVDAAVDGCTAHVLLAATGAVTRAQQQEYRHWSDDDWDAAADGLQQRGWIDPDGSLTPEGADAHDAIERRTDELALGPLRVLGDDGVARLLDRFASIGERLGAGGAVPYPNPMGVRPARAG